jgi:hypothetical protein
LDERWGVGRIVDSLSPLEPVWRFTPPLRLAAVLSCLDVPAADEWNAISQACQGSQLPMEILVLVSEEALEADIRASAPANVTVEFVPATVEDLQQRLQMFRPHVLHMFCHGPAAADSPHLQIATKPDWLGASTSSLLVEAGELRDFTPRTDNLPWLVVLNSCASATTAGAAGTQSVAFDLVYEGGVPAVVGMREPVRSDDATLFTEAFYAQLVPELARRVAGAGADGTPVDWARLAVDARRRLVKKHQGLLGKACASKEWTLPVVYTRPLLFAVQAAPGPSGHQGPPPQGSPRLLQLEIAALTGLRAQLAATGDAPLLADIDDHIAGLTAQLRETSSLRP